MARALGSNLVVYTALARVACSDILSLGAPEGRLSLPIVIQVCLTVIPLPSNSNVVPLVIRPAAFSAL